MEEPRHAKRAERAMGAGLGGVRLRGGGMESTRTCGELNLRREGRVARWCCEESRLLVERKAGDAMLSLTRTRQWYTYGRELETHCRGAEKGCRWSLGDRAGYWVSSRQRIDMV